MSNFFKCTSWEQQGLLNSDIVYVVYSHYRYFLTEILYMSQMLALMMSVMVHFVDIKCQHMPLKIITYRICKTPAQTHPKKNFQEQRNWFLKKENNAQLMWTLQKGLPNSQTRIKIQVVVKKMWTGRLEVSHACCGYSWKYYKPQLCWLQPFLHRPV